MRTLTATKYIFLVADKLKVHVHVPTAKYINLKYTILIRHTSMFYAKIHLSRLVFLWTR